MMLHHCQTLNRDKKVTHGFFTRHGGVSTGLYSSLNTAYGSEDDRAAIQENRKRILEKIAPEARLCTLHQTHSCDVIQITEPWEEDDAPKADAMATALPNVALGILTADCAPILFADTEAGIIGAAHAGWKGALAGIAEKTITAMVGLGADTARIHATIGPCIQHYSYEVDEKFYQRFRADNLFNGRYFVPSNRQGHYYFNLPAYIKQRLEDANISSISQLKYDTLDEADQFFSYRRSSLAGETDYGRQMSVIALKP